MLEEYRATTIVYFFSINFVSSGFCRGLNTPLLAELGSLLCHKGGKLGFTGLVCAMA